MEAIGEEGKDCLSFFATCGAALWASPPKDHGVLMTPFHLLLGNVPLSTLLNISPQYLLLDMNLPHWLLILLPPWHLGLQPYPNGDTTVLWTVSPPQSEATPRVAPEKPTHSKRREEMPLHKALTTSWWEAFARDLDLVWKAREEHYKTNCLHFNCETSHDLTNMFWDLIASTSLLGSQIYKIQEVSEGQSELQYAHDALRALPKCLQFFHPISPSELPKVMGLAGIHNPDTLCCFNSLTFCPWCRKEGHK